MTQSEAIQKIESWLLVPVDYENIIPALASIRHTPDFTFYLKRVAEVEYTSPSEIEKTIDQYLAFHPNQNPYSSLDEKLSRISGRNNRQVANELNAKPMDILDELNARRAQKQNGKSEEEKLSDAYQSYVNGYVSKKETNLPARKCTYCDTPLETREVKTLSTKAIIWIFILIFICPPLILIPIIFGREKKLRYYCTRCGRIHL